MRILLFLWVLLVPLVAYAQELTVFAAASLTDALKEISGQWAKAGQQPLRLSFGSSSTLARQIEQGAPANVFASADEKWMDFLAAKGLIVADTRVGVSAIWQVGKLVSGRHGFGRSTPHRLTRRHRFTKLRGDSGFARGRNRPRRRTRCIGDRHECWNRSADQRRIATDRAGEWHRTDNRGTDIGQPHLGHNIDQP
jgi:hypothetical protein